MSLAGARKVHGHTGIGLPGSAGVTPAWRAGDPLSLRATAHVALRACAGETPALPGTLFPQAAAKPHGTPTEYLQGPQ